MQKQHGVTLLELMIVVAVIGILSAIAYPSYQSYIARGYRADAHTELFKIANLQEQFYLDQQSYASSLSMLGALEQTENKRYSLAMEVSNASYVIIASAIGVQKSIDAECLILATNELGQKGIINSDDEFEVDKSCW